MSLRIDADGIDELRGIASPKGIGYQPLIRMWVMGRLEQETKPSWFPPAADPIMWLAKTLASGSNPNAT